jgi:dolichyl-phosphate-mannose--protein O-mannosyl transferase
VLVVAGGIPYLLLLFCIFGFFLYIAFHFALLGVGAFLNLLSSLLSGSPRLSFLDLLFHLSAIALAAFLVFSPLLYIIAEASRPRAEQAEREEGGSGGR